jgi:hypothetical protein
MLLLLLLLLDFFFFWYLADSLSLASINWFVIVRKTETATTATKNSTGITSVSLREEKSVE